jgi:Fic family protein
MRYIHQLKDWPEFYWDESAVLTRLVTVRNLQGLLLGRVEGLGFSLKSETTLNTLISDVLKSSEIEGEVLDRNQVRSSIARKLGMDIAGLVPADKEVEGVVEMMLDATQSFRKRLTATRLYGWHSSLFPSGRSGMYKITVGAWRNNPKEDPMQVVSGPLGFEKVHFHAPDAELLADQMKAFLAWFNAKDKLDPVLKAGLAHLWFITVHPFDDGNGRIARTITDMALSRADNTSQRFYSMSTAIRNDRKGYYRVLERAQKGGLDVTEWLLWFLDCMKAALDATTDTMSLTLKKARFWETHAKTPFNERQSKILNRLFDGFEGKLTSSKWAKMGKCSQDTAGRDIKDLLEKKVLIKAPGRGRSTNYELNL